MAKTIIRVNSENILDLDVDTRNHTLSGNIIDEINNTSYPVGGSGGGLPTMALTLINNANEDLYLDTTVTSNIRQVDYGTISMLPGIQTNDEQTQNVLYLYQPPLFDQPEKYIVKFTYVNGDEVRAIPTITDLVNCTISATPLPGVTLTITDPSQPSSATVTLAIPNS